MHFCPTLLYNKNKCFRFPLFVQSCNRAAGCCCSFMVGRGRWTGCRCCSLASIATGRRITLARAMFHGLFPARCARTQNARNVTPGGKLCEILHFAPKCVDLQTVIVSDARRGRSHIPPPIGRGAGRPFPVWRLLSCAKI